MLPSLLIIAVFFIFAILMISKKISALIAMPLMAFFIAVISGLCSHMPLYSDNPGIKSVFSFVFNNVLSEGSVKLSNAIMYTVFGSILSQVVQKTKIAEKIIKCSAELAGDKKLLVAVVLTLASVFVFTSLTGVGAFIMVASLVLPVMTASGISPLLSSSLLLFSLSIGGILNTVNWGFYRDTLGVDEIVIKDFTIPYALILLVMAFIFMFVTFIRDKNIIAWSVPVVEEENDKIPFYAFLTPVMPILLVINPWFPLPVIPAFIISAVYGIVAVNVKKFIPLFTASVIDGIRDIAPVIGLFIGIGMLLNSLAAPSTSEIMKPLLSMILPETRVAYVLFFAILAPLALYRGPFNLYGLGSGLAALMIGGNFLSPMAVMAAFMAVGQIQGVCDPTNTHNVWLAQYMKITANELMTKTIIYVWIFVVIALLYSVFARNVI